MKEMFNQGTNFLPFAIIHLTGIPSCILFFVMSVNLRFQHTLRYFKASIVLSRCFKKSYIQIILQVLSGKIDLTLTFMQE